MFAIYPELRWKITNIPISESRKYTLHNINKYIGSFHWGYHPIPGSPATVIGSRIIIPRLNRRF